MPQYDEKEPIIGENGMKSLPDGPGGTDCEAYMPEPPLPPLALLGCCIVV